jgi:alkyldihydroxyacetonephosphate synthase
VTIDRAIASAAPHVPQSQSPVDRALYARDLWPRHHLAVRDGEIAAHEPSLVVWPRSTAEVAAIVRTAAAEGAPIAPFGAGSGVCGGTLPDRRTVVVDMKRMERIVGIDEARGILDVEAGAMGIRLEEDLEDRGYTLGHFPSSILCSTVGGWIAARSAGQCSGLYGKIEDMVVDLECVLGDGRVVTFARRTHGPDLTPILVGSEGVLGVVTRARLRLHRAPAERTFAAYSFPSVPAGFEAMREMFQAGLRPAVSRLYDAFDSWMAKRGSVKTDGPKVKKSEARSRGQRFAIKSLLRAPNLLNELVDRIGDKAFGGVTLVLVFEGTADEGRADRARAAAIAQRHGARDLGEGPARHWFAHRYSVSYRQAPIFMAGAFSDTMEVAAPWSRLGELYESVRRAMRGKVFVMAHLSHAYPDGCSIYFTFAGSSPTRAEAEAKYDAVWADALDAAIAAGGTLSHHHGVGRSKAPKLGSELGLGIEIVHALRGVFDPSGILNPGNLVPRSSDRRGPEAEIPKSVRFDDVSLLAHAPGTATLGAVEEAAAARGLSLRVAGLDPAETVAHFLARGAPGSLDPWLDPVDHFVAGFTAKMTSGADLVVRPGPRRAVGPDLYALFHGQGERAGVLTSAHLRVHRSGLEPRPLASGVERNPPLSGDERDITTRALAAASGVTR